MTTTLHLEWKTGPIQGTLEVRHGTLTKAVWTKGKGRWSGTRFSCPARGPCRLALTLEEVHVGPGAFATTVSILAEPHPFTFFLRDVRREFPIYIPTYGVAVMTADDPQSYEDIEAAIRSVGRQTRLQAIEAEPDESFETAAQYARRLRCPIWLGIGRDVRGFELEFPNGGLLDGRVAPRFRSQFVADPEEGKAPELRFAVGRGVGVCDTETRCLDEGCLPIFHNRIVDDEIYYHCTAFVTLEKRPLTAAYIRGTHFLFADSLLNGHMLTPDQQKELESLAKTESRPQEETVLFFRARAVNTGSVPRHAIFKTLYHSIYFSLPTCRFDPATGLSSYASGRVYVVSKLNGRPLPQEEVAILLGPGETADLEFYMPHAPISKVRALALIRQNFDQRFHECRNFWQGKLRSAAQFRLPEKRIDQMVKAGLLHLDLIFFGLEPNGTLAASNGMYCPIGSESAPIIQFTDTMARHREAERCLQYFLDKQHDDGLIQNFGGYMLETGAALWSMSEHYRYTRDDRWLRRVRPQLIKSCDFLIRWRRRNLREDLRGKGYGLMDGKVADPEDPFRAFMLNGYAYMGLSRVAEMLAKLDPNYSRKLKHAQDLKQDIRTAFFDGLARGPVVPLSDGSWIPTAPPWAEYQGPVSLYAEGGNWYTHGTFTARDGMLGPLYLVFHEVIAPDELAADFLVNFQTELMCTRNTAFSQPYYSLHPIIHLWRGETKPFLKSYYNTFAGLADRETYSF
jgi:hypothetical protein